MGHQVESSQSRDSRITHDPAVGPERSDESGVPADAAHRRLSHEEPYCVRLSRQAMACHFEVFLNAGQYVSAPEVALESLDLVDRLESQLTVYRDSSEVVSLNRSAALDPIEVEPNLFELISRSVALSALTEGAFDITSGPLIKLWNQFRRSGTLPDAEAIRNMLEIVGSQHIEMNPASRTIHYRREGIEINFGAIGKGYALDGSAELLQGAGVADFLLHGGQSSVLAVGSRAGFSPGGWPIGIGHPLNSDRRLAEIYLRNRAIATSGTSRQFFRYQQKRYGHILDPRTGWPAEGIFSSTAFAPNATEADALATAFYVMGTAATVEFCRSQPQYGALLVHPSCQGNTIQVTTAGLASEDWRLLAPIVAEYY